MARLLILRAEEEARRSAASLAAIGHDAVVAPIVAFAPTGRSAFAGGVQALIATSARAIRCLSESETRILATLPFFAVGEATATAARKAGFAAVVEGGGQAEALVETIRQHTAPPGPLLYLAGAPRRPTVEAALAATGFHVSALLLYRMEPVSVLPENARQALADDTLDAVLHYSAETAALFVRLARSAGLAAEAARPAHLSLSVAVARELGGLPSARNFIAEQPIESALFELIRDLPG